MKHSFRLFSLILCFTLPFLLSACEPRHKLHFPEGKGSLDLSEWDFPHQGIVTLQGQWEMYWGELLSPEELSSASPPRLVQFPGLWKDEGGASQQNTAHGQATYRLLVTTPPTINRLGMLIRCPLAVARIYVNGKEIGATGKVGLTKEQELPQLHFLHVNFSAKGGSNEIVLQISNHRNVRGGLHYPILLGTAEQIDLLVNRKFAIGLMLGGILFVMGMVHLLLFSSLRTNRANLYFGLYCIMWSVSSLAGETWGSPIASLFPGLPWEATIYLALFPYGFSVPLLVMFYHTLFTKRYSRQVETIYQALGASYLLYLLVTPVNAFATGVVLYHFVSLTVFLYLFFQLCIDLKNREKDTGWLIPGYALLSLSCLLNILYDFQLVDFKLFVPYGTIGFVVSYSILISVRFSRTYQTIKQLSRELESKNILESRQYQSPQEEGPDNKQLTEPIPEKRLQRAELAVTVMNLTLSHWHECTGASKADFAGQSGLWKVYMDKNGWERTQTLDKYLDKETIPGNPRYTWVVQSAEYVLTRFPESSFQADIEQALYQLKTFH